ncbi:MAG: peptidase domain-containing ABC transporter [Blastocatellia bacterium]
MAEHQQTGGHMAGHEQHEPMSPAARLRKMLRPDVADLAGLLAYTTLTGILSLVVPLAAQFTVNTIAAGVFMQPLVVLTLAVLLALALAGLLRILKLALLERLQQRVFARIALELAELLPNIRYTALANEYAPQLVNRFFDVINIQKSLAKLLLDGPTAMLQVLLGLTLMAFYSPYLLAFDLFLILFVLFIVVVLGMGGLRTSVHESYQKYHVAEWLEELARCHRGFKLNATSSFAIEKADELVVGYVRARRAHFRVLLRQAIGHYTFRAVASAGTLAIGGALVINQQLTLGQLVAAELVIVVVLEALEKLIRMLEVVYDLLTAVDKVGHVTDMPVERRTGKPLPAGRGGAEVVCRNVRFAWREGAEILSDLNLNIRAGERVSLVGKSGAGKSTLVSLLCGLHEPVVGMIMVNGMDVRDASLTSLRRAISMVGDGNEIFEGTIEENILMGREHISHEDLQWAIEMTQLSDDLSRMPEGLRTHLIGEGRNLSRGQMQRLLIARAVVARPQLLILDEGFTGIDEKDKLAILRALYAPEREWTIIDISHDPEVVMHASVVHVLSGGRIAESDTPEKITQRRNSAFSALFPTLGMESKR